MQWILSKDFTTIEYYGRNHMKSYQDRASVHIYRYLQKQPVSAQYSLYVTPQETGNKTVSAGMQ